MFTDFRVLSGSQTGSPRVNSLIFGITVRRYMSLSSAMGRLSRVNHHSDLDTLERMRKVSINVGRKGRSPVTSASARSSPRGSIGKFRLARRDREVRANSMIQDQAKYVVWEERLFDISSGPVVEPINLQCHIAKVRICARPRVRYAFVNINR
ncbi:hypothetical protein PM082_009687 [Marasmius tenuissimus]|nr:hypothetical protein PM082_009687 [Marasmius tenuissimus]